MAFEGVPFQRVFSRMTAAELKSVLQAQSLLTGSGDDPPSNMTAEGALSWYDWNNGAGSYYSTSPDYRYSGGRYPSNKHGIDIRSDLETAFNANRASFLSGFTAQRQAELTSAAHPDTSTPGVTRPIAIWNQSQYSGVTPPDSSKIMLPVEMWYSSGSPRYTATQAAALLAAQTAGRRCIKIGSSYAHPISSFASIPTNSASTNNKYREGFFNRDFDTFHAHGVLCDTWHTAMTDVASTWRTWWEDLRSIGGADIIDHLILDVNEVIQPRFWKRTSLAGPSPSVEGTDVSVTIDTGTNILTATGHGLETGQPFKFRTTSGTLPKILGQFVSTALPYYVRRIDADTFYLHLTPGAALAAGTPRDFDNAGVSVLYRSYAETLANWFLDSTDWATARTTILLPVLSQAIWNTYDDWNYNTDERVFLFEAAYEKYLADKWADVLQIVLDEFPNLKISDYNAAYRCPATRSTYSPPAFSHFPYGAGQQIGGLSSYSNYMQYDDRVWKWSTLTTGQQIVADAALTWATLVQGIASMRSVLAADPDNVEMWVSPTAKAVSIPEDDPMASEFLLHMVLPSVARIGFYNSAVVEGQTAPTVAQQTLALNLIAERDAMVGYSPAILDPQLDLDADYSIDVITTRVWAGGRWVWRVTPRPAATTTVTQTRDSVRFDCDGQILNIGNASLVQPATEYAPSGYWVIERVADVAPYPSDLPTQDDTTYSYKRPAEAVYPRTI